MGSLRSNQLISVYGGKIRKRGGNEDASNDRQWINCIKRGGGGKRKKGMLIKWQQHTALNWPLSYLVKKQWPLENICLVPHRATETQGCGEGGLYEPRHTNLHQFTLLAAKSRTKENIAKKNFPNQNQCFQTLSTIPLNFGNVRRQKIHRKTPTRTTLLFEEHCICLANITPKVLRPETSQILFHRPSKHFLIKKSSTAWLFQPFFFKEIMGLQPHCSPWASIEITIGGVTKAFWPTVGISLSRLRLSKPDAEELRCANQKFGNFS